LSCRLYVRVIQFASEATIPARDATVVHVRVFIAKGVLLLLVLKTFA
jgi:hypothetical protein